MTMFYCVPRKRCPQLSLGSEGKLVFDGELEIDCADIWLSVEWPIYFLGSGPLFFHL
jgi:hypothetical protein